ncbi:hypothetical protein KVG29_10980 [Caldicoprobacter algeriensis]|uniref:hypothetical protein n=1 Tax=Caldicoprobacter algeriensis TaxID=699281 RepID=UPI0020796091|nr:hypothetical protein [Caldicoprobacter algeriensis]MCM8901740.1 hypothetical protein [Caldicoprobacter algeriensis]
MLVVLMLVARVRVVATRSRQFSYIRTYQTTTGGIQITAGPGGVGAGFALQTTPKQ